LDHLGDARIRPFAHRKMRSRQNGFIQHHGWIMNIGLASFFAPKTLKPKLVLESDAGQRIQCAKGLVAANRQ